MGGVKHYTYHPHYPLAESRDLDVQGEIHVCDWLKNPYPVLPDWAHTEAQAFQPITDVYFTPYIKSRNFAKPNDSASDSGGFRLPLMIWASGSQASGFVVWRSRACSGFRVLRVFRV